MLLLATERWLKRSGVFTIALTVLLILLGLQTVHANSSRGLAIDTPPGCEQDTIDISLNGEIFRLPRKSVTLIDGRWLRDIGCPDDPVVAVKVFLGISFNSALRGKGPEYGKAYSMTLLAYEMSSEWDDLRERLKRDKESKLRQRLAQGDHDPLAHGLYRFRANTHNDAAKYMAPRDQYSTPLGDPFIVQCLPTLSFDEKSGRQCLVGYSLTEKIGFSYKFYDKLLPINELIEVDKQFRQKVIGFRVDK